MKPWVPVIISMAVASAGVTQGGEATHIYALGSGQSVQLTVPAGWIETVTNSPVNSLLTIRFLPKTGNEFTALFTFGRPLGRHDLRADVERTGRMAISSSKEGEINIKTLGGAETSGYFFSMTENSPTSGEWKFLTQGIVRVGEWQAAFTILSNDPGRKVEERGLEMLRSAMVVNLQVNKE